MKKTSIAVAALLSTLSMTTVIRAAYADEAMGGSSTTMCQGCSGCKGCKGCKGAPSCSGATSSCSGCSGS